jgi:hypothetical protein
MDKVLFILFVPFILCCQNKENKIEVSQPVVVSGNGVAGCPYFTRDHQGKPVMCWTAGEEGKQQLYYARYNDKEEKFTEPVAIAPSTGTVLRGESMNKIAFKKDGTIVAVYERKHPSEENKYAGSILYVQSFDQGKTWTKEKHLHTDTLRTNSRSFFDIAILPDGEIGAVWLDSRFKTGKEGSALFFAKTNGKDGFQTDHPIGETVCECCRTDLYVDANGNIHIVYRDIETTIKGQVRDFVHSVSSDNGTTFQPSHKISNDNWVIDGCPHTGASMVVSDGALAVTWFTAGGSPGLYFTRSLDNGNTFEPRRLLSEDARHPQLSSSDKNIVAVWDETQSKHDMHAGHSAGSHTASGSIIFLVLDSDKENVSIKIPESEGGEFPVVYSLNDHIALVAYTKNEKVVTQVVKQ